MNPRFAWRVASCLVLSVGVVTSSGCGPDTRETQESADGGLASTGTAGDGASDESGDSAGGGGSDEEVQLDVAPGSDGTGGDVASGCEKVDFLFVIDNSASMAQHQDALVAAFPEFIGAIQDEVQAQDYHILVTDSDEDPTMACEGAYPNVECGDPFVCGDYPCGSHTLLDACDRTLGGGVVAPRGGHTQNGPCGVPAGQRHITGAQPDLEETFACIATTGTSGDWDERPMTAMVEAVSPASQTNAGACNDGFLRDDAILVVTVMSTGDADTSKEAATGDPQQWYDALVEAKGGDASGIVVLLVVTPSVCDPLFGCSGSPPYMEFSEMFGGQGLIEPISSEDYLPFFESAVSLIDATCDTWDPEG